MELNSSSVGHAGNGITPESCVKIDKSLYVTSVSAERLFMRTIFTM